MFFQVMDATAAPIQGILRGYKDVKATFWAGLAAYWLICLPLGCYFDYCLNLGPSSYWLSLDIGLLCAVLFLGGRFLYLQRKIKINGGLE